MREGGKRFVFVQQSLIRNVVAMAMSSFYKLIMIMEKSGNWEFHWGYLKLYV